MSIRFSFKNKQNKIKSRINLIWNIDKKKEKEKKQIINRRLVEDWKSERKIWVEKKETTLVKLFKSKIIKSNNENENEEHKHILYSPGTIALCIMDQENSYVVQHHDIVI